MFLHILIDLFKYLFQNVTTHLFIHVLVLKKINYNNLPLKKKIGYNIKNMLG